VDESKDASASSGQFLDYQLTDQCRLLKAPPVVSSTRFSPASQRKSADMPHWLL
jgi:hypothetical protein